MAATSFTQRQISQAMGRLVLSDAFFSAVIGVVAGVQMFRLGWSQQNLWLLFGAFASIAARAYRAGLAVTTWS